ncbi:TIGR00341 family protein [Salinigranum salinum]|uniref:TIGR00341 family protein n=1 Tax=Salinigranum salinum TaxID=1364937 RepID=UPI001260FE24|nr:TIGR00341 family protein [Salinigranum salinum]
MRFIHALVPQRHRDDVLGVLADERIDYVVTEEADSDDDAIIVQFPLPAQAVDAVLADLREAGLDDSFTVIANAETAATPNFAELEERFVEGSEEDDAVVPEEIRSKARDLNPGRRTYYAMTLLSVLVATIGLLLDSPAIVVGSMVIAPQVGAALTASVGVAFSEGRMVRNGIVSQVVGLGVAVGSATAFGWLLRTTQFVSGAVDVTTIAQISARTSPGVLSLLVGVCAGAAGAFGLATDLPVSLVGVAVAAALIPAAAAVGIGVAWGYPVVAFGAAVLLVVNILTITASGAVALWYLGYRPEQWRETTPRDALRSGGLNATIAALLAIAVVTGGVGAAVVEQSAFENATNDAVEDVLDASAYDELDLLTVQVEFTSFGLADAPREVTVRVRRPADESYPAFPRRLEDEVTAATDTDVTVSVEYVETATTTTSRESREARVSQSRGATVRNPNAQHAHPVDPGDRSNVISSPQSGQSGGPSPSTSRSRTRSLQS